MADVEDLMPGMYKDVPEAIREIFHRMPFGQKIEIGGRAAEIVKLSPEPREKTEGATGTGWCFMFDIRFEQGAPDHLEFTVKHTGGGGFVAEPIG